MFLQTLHRTNVVNLIVVGQQPQSIFPSLSFKKFINFFWTRLYSRKFCKFNFAFKAFYRDPFEFTIHRKPNVHWKICIDRFVVINAKSVGSVGRELVAPVRSAHPCRWCWCSWCSPCPARCRLSGSSHGNSHRGACWVWWTGAGPGQRIQRWIRTMASAAGENIGISR